MTVRMSTAITVGAAFLIFVLGLPFLWYFSKPTYFPSTVFQPAEGERAQTIGELSRSSKLCDEAVRSLLLAYATELNDLETSSSPTPLERAFSLVESENALVPIECQKLIDPIAIASDTNYEAELVALKQHRGDLSAQVRIINRGSEPAFLALGSEFDIKFSDDLTTYFHSYRVGGIYECAYSSCLDGEKHFTRIAPGAIASVTIEADAVGTPGSSAVSFAMTLFEARDGQTIGTVSFGFVDIKPNS